MILELPNILDDEQLAQLRELFEHAPRQDGAHSAGPIAKRAKANQELVSHTPEHDKMVHIVQQALINYEPLDRAVWPVASTIPLFSEYRAGMYYHNHFDAACIRSGVNPGSIFPGRFRFDVSATLFLNAPEDYTGGELMIETAAGTCRAKCPPGTMITYPSGYRHRVTQLSRGVRRVAVLWFQSYFRDSEQRHLIYQMDQALGELLKRYPDDSAVATTNYVLNNLIRMWGDAG